MGIKQKGIFMYGNNYGLNVLSHIANIL